MIKSIKETSRKTYRKYDHTFKCEAARNWLNSGKSAEVVAAELGIQASRLYAWKKLVADDAAPKPSLVKPGSVADLQRQLDAAQRELRHTREQVVILKKTLGILSEPSSNDTNGSTR